MRGRVSSAVVVVQLAVLQSWLPVSRQPAPGCRSDRGWRGLVVQCLPCGDESLRS